jgi:hypothetical protein
MVSSRVAGPSEHHAWPGLVDADGSSPVFLCGDLFLVFLGAWESHQEWPFPLGPVCVFYVGILTFYWLFGFCLKRW